MRVLGSLSAASRRVFMTFGVAAALCASMSVQAVPAQTQTPAPPAGPDPFEFKTDYALIFNNVKTDKVADWEAAWKQIKTLLTASDKPDLKQQGESISIMKIDGAPAGPTTAYVIVLNPPSKTQSYRPDKIVYYSGLLPADKRADQDALYKKLAEALADANPMSPIPLAKIGG